MVMCFTLSIYDLQSCRGSLIHCMPGVSLLLMAHPLDKKKQDDEHIPSQDSDPHNPDTPFIYPVYILDLIWYLDIAWWYSRCYRLAGVV